MAKLPDNSGYTELVRQYAFLSSLTAGFAFAALTQVSIEEHVPTALKLSFFICTSLAIFLEIFATITASILAFSSRHPDFSPTFQDKPLILLNTSFAVGLLLVLTSTVLIVWIKNPTIGFYISLAGILTVISILWMLRTIMLSLSRDEYRS